jgi:hypothetical protein
MAPATALKPACGLYPYRLLRQAFRALRGGASPTAQQCRQNVCGRGLPGAATSLLWATLHCLHKPKHPHPPAGKADARWGRDAWCASGRGCSPPSDTPRELLLDSLVSTGTETGEGSGATFAFARLARAAVSVARIEKDVPSRHTLCTPRPMVRVDPPNTVSYPPRTIDHCTPGGKVPSWKDRSILSSSRVGPRGRSHQPRESTRWLPGLATGQEDARWACAPAKLSRRLPNSRAPSFP